MSVFQPSTCTVYFCTWFENRSHVYICIAYGGEMIRIEENSLDKSYLEVFGKYLDECNVVELSDPDLIKSKQNLRCLHAFIEVLIIKKVKYVFIVTKDAHSRVDIFKQIIDSCRSHKIYIAYSFIKNNHNVQCEKCIKFYQTSNELEKVVYDDKMKGSGLPCMKTVLNNCKSYFTAKINIGLNYFQQPDYDLINQNKQAGKETWQPGFQNYSLKPCKRVDIIIGYTEFKSITALQYGLFSKTHGDLQGHFDGAISLMEEKQDIKFLSEEGKRQFIAKIEKVQREISFTRAVRTKY